MYLPREASEHTTKLSMSKLDSSYDLDSTEQGTLTHELLEIAKRYRLEADQI
jgi:hypothetical protein